jgi:hypothetical protein
MVVHAVGADGVGPDDPDGEQSVVPSATNEAPMSRGESVQIPSAVVTRVQVPGMAVPVGTVAVGDAVVGAGEVAVGAEVGGVVVAGALVGPPGPVPGRQPVASVAVSEASPRRRSAQVFEVLITTPCHLNSTTGVPAARGHNVPAAESRFTAVSSRFHNKVIPVVAQGAF